MNSKYLIGLLFTAGAAFALGWVVKPSGQDGGVAGNAMSPGTGGNSLVPAPTRTVAQLEEDRAIEENSVTEAPFITKYLQNGALDEKGMERAMAELLAESDPIKMNQMMAEVLARMTPENAQVAMKAIQNLGSRDPSQFYLTSLFASAWGRMDGAKAVAYMQEQNSGRASMMGSAAALSGWAMGSPDEALAWLGEQEENPQNMIYTSGVISGLAKSDPAKATEFLNTIPEDNQMRGRYVDILAAEQAKLGMDEATSWAEGLDDEGLRSDAFEDLANRFTQQDPAKAGEWIASRADEAWAKDAVVEVADEWAEQDPAAAVEWAHTLPEDSQLGAMSAALKEWTESDPTTASEYLADMEASPVRDQAVAGFTDQLAREDPQSAVTWAETIQDEGTRVEALTDAARAWMRQDQEAATAWLQSSGLPAEAQQKVTAPPEQRGFGGFGDFIRGGRN